MKNQKSENNIQDNGIAVLTDFHKIFCEIKHKMFEKELTKGAKCIKIIL